MNTFYIKKLEEIDKTAKEFIEVVKGQKIFAFYGKMGSGKTTFIKELCKQLGSDENITSPTFSIVNEYETNNNGLIYHFDFYRIENQEEAYDLGYEDYLFSDNYCFIEWPELIENLLPENCIRVNIEELEDGTRQINI